MVRRMKRYDFIFSIGQACSCTENLRKANLQVMSYPFDWLYGTSIKERVDLLVSDFKGWFEKNDFVFDCYKDGSRFNVYRNTHTKLIFNHDFPKDDDFDTGYVKVAAKYERRVARLLEKIESSRRVLSVYVEQPYTREYTSDEELMHLKAKLDARFGEGKVELLYIHHGESLKSVCREATRGVWIMALDYKSRKAGAFDYQVDRKRLAKAIKTQVGLSFTARIKWIAAKLKGQGR